MLVSLRKLQGSLALSISCITSAKMWIYRIVFFWFIGGIDSCLIDTNLSDVIDNMTEGFSIEKVERMGVLEYDLSMVLQWNVSRDVEFDGVLYYFSDATKIGPRNVAPPLIIPGFQGTTDPCHNVNSTIWTVDKNGSSIECQIPCEGIIENRCTHHGICDLLGSGYKSLSKETRSLKLTMRFGQRYIIWFYAYRDWRFGPEQKFHLKESVAFCRHELITALDVEKEHANEYCEENQEIDEKSFTTGPISNLEIVEKRINLNSNRGEVVLRWKDPHDILPATKVISHHTNPTNARILNKKELDASSKSPDGYYRVTFGNIELHKKTIVRITPVTNTTYCQLPCKRQGRTVTEFIEFKDIDACTENLTDPFCVPLAKCQDLPPDGNIAALCTCPDGYTGNGRNPVYDGGTGCKIYDGCENVTKVEEVCAQSASCTESLTPWLYFNCSCPEGFYGDGYLDGTGCTYNTSTETTIIASVCVVAFFIILALLLTVYCRKRQRDLKFKLTSQFQASLFNTIKNSSSDSAVGVFGEKWELDRNNIELKGVIGRGNFGVVHRGVFKTEYGEELVAVKMTTDATSEEYKMAFKHEIYLLSEIDKHDNLLGLIGCCTGGDQSWYMVTQYMKYGDLLRFLWKCRETSHRAEDPIYHINELNVYHIASQVACGMRHLTKMRIIHGDLAARNVLIGEGLSCKISDFGLANNVYEEGLLRNVIEKTVPLRWVSPERMMDGRVPIDWRSDVWSYGILLYETVTLGATPYAGIESEDLFAKLKSGYRMQRPPFCTESLYNIMRRCWEWRPSKRPTFAGLEKLMNEPAQPDGVTYVNLHTVVADLDPRYESSNTTNSTPRTIANNFAQSFVQESEKLV